MEGGTLLSALIIILLLLLCTSLPGTLAAGAPAAEEVLFTVDALSLALGNNTAILPAIAVNGDVLGPTLHVERGSRLVVRVRTTAAVRGMSIHWHGFELRGDAQAYDGSEAVYNFTVTEHPGTYYWLHAHVHAAALGLAHNLVKGALIVHGEGGLPPAARRTPLAYDSDRIVFFTDLLERPGVEGATRVAGNLWPAPSRSDAGDIVGVIPWRAGLVNGAESGKVEISVQAGRTYRFRLINGGELFAIRVSIPGLTFTAVATDAADCEPLDVDAVFLFSGERYDVEVHIPTSSEGMLRAARQHYRVPRSGLHLSGSRCHPGWWRQWRRGTRAIPPITTAPELLPRHGARHGHVHPGHAAAACSRRGAAAGSHRARCRTQHRL